MHAEAEGVRRGIEHPVLQWGPAQDAGKGELSRRHKEELAEASMGPGSGRREGELYHTGNHEAADGASMRPGSGRREGGQKPVGCFRRRYLLQWGPAQDAGKGWNWLARAVGPEDLLQWGPAQDAGKGTSLVDAVMSGVGGEVRERCQNCSNATREKRTKFRHFTEIIGIPPHTRAQPPTRGSRRRSQKCQKHVAKLLKPPQAGRAPQRRSR